MTTDADKPKETAAEAPAGGSAKTILLVDDEVVVLKVGRRILERLGYRVLSTPRAVEALQVIEEAGACPDLAIVDLVMPGMSGRELLVALKSRHPETKVIVASGYSGGDPEGDLEALGCDGFIEKPFDMKTLENMVRKAIGEPPRG